MNTVKKSLLIVLPDEDFNELEYITVKTILENAGLKLFIASDSNSLCIGSKGLRVRADVKFYNMHEQNFAGIVFIGGSGIKKYWDNSFLKNIALRFYKAGKTTSAICSAPVILAKAGILKDAKVTCYPNDRHEIEKLGVGYVDSPMVIHKNIITAQGPSAAEDFANAIIDRIS